LVRERERGREGRQEDKLTCVSTRNARNPEHGQEREGEREGGREERNVKISPWS